MKPCKCKSSFCYLYVCLCNFKYTFLVKGGGREKLQKCLELVSGGGKKECNGQLKFTAAVRVN